MADFPGFIPPVGGDTFGDLPGGDRDNYANAVPSTDSLTGRPLDNDIPCFGTAAAGSPIKPAAVDRPGFCANSIAEDWVDRIHVIPRRFDFGNILGTINTTVDIFSAFRTQDVSWTSFVNNSGPGFSITNLPTFPDTIGSFSGRTLNIEVTTNGVPQFNTTMDFVFDVGTTMVPITGSRVIMFPYRPEQPMRETLSFLTDVFEHKDGSEQRVALRKNPRQSFNLRYNRELGTERSRLDFLMFDWQSRVFGLPMWHEPMSVTSAITVSDTVVSVDTTDFTDIRVGGLAIVLAPDEVTFDALEISSFTGTSITFNSPLQNAYPVGTQVYPIRTAVADGIIRGSQGPVGLGQLDIRFRVLDNNNDLADTAAFNTFMAKVFLDGANFIDGSQIRETATRRMVQFDNQTGVFSQDSPWTRNKRGTSKTFMTQTREELWQVRQLLHALRGRQVSFWMPTFRKEIVPTELLANGSSTITITNVGYTQFVQNRSPKNEFRVVLKDGTLLQRTVDTSAEVDKDTEQITFTTPWPQEIAIDEIDRIEILEKVRIDSDEIPIVHSEATGKAKITFPTKVVFE